MRMRATFEAAAPSPFTILLPPLTVFLDRRYLRHHFCTFSRLAVDFQVAAQQCHPLTHAGETQTLAGPTPVGYLLRVEAGPPIPHLQANRVVQAPECDPHPGGGSMLVHVGEGLLCDPEKRRLDLGRQALVSQRFLVVDLGALVADLLDLQADGGRQPEIVERCGPQICYNVSGLTDRLLHQMESPSEVFASFVGGGWVLPGECLQELVGTCGRLCETVVHLVRDLSALLFLGRYELPDQVLQPVLTLGQLSVEPRVLQGACTLVCEADQGLFILPLHKGFRSVGFEHTYEPAPHQQWEVQAHELQFARILRLLQPDGLVLPGLQYFLAGCHRLGGEASLAPQSLQSRGTPDAQFPVLVRDTDDRGGEIRDAACYLQ